MPLRPIGTIFKMTVSCPEGSLNTADYYPKELTWRVKGHVMASDTMNSKPYLHEEVEIVSIKELQEGLCFNADFADQN